jgi:hypothetical protein
MLSQNKRTNKKILHPIRLIFILLVAMLIPINGYAADIDAEVTKAVLKGDTAAMQLLLSQGANIKTKDRIYGRTLLHLAVERGHRDMVELLIANGAEVNAKDEVNGWTPLHQAAQRDDRVMAQLLIANKANVNIKDEVNNRTPLFFAVLWGNKDMVELLVANGADINAKAYFDTTVLHLASERGDKDMVQLLVSKGADVNAKDEVGETAMGCARDVATLRSLSYSRMPEPSNKQPAKDRGQTTEVRSQRSEDRLPILNLEFRNSNFEILTPCFMPAQLRCIDRALPNRHGRFLQSLGKGWMTVDGSGNVFGTGTEFHGQHTFCYHV